MEEEVRDRQDGPLGFTLCERLARNHDEVRIKGCHLSAKYAVAMENR